MKHKKIIKVKIVSSEHETYWYSNHIGEIFEVYRPIDMGCYHVVDCVDGRLIGVEDCVEVKDSDTVINPLEAMKVIDEKYRFRNDLEAWNVIKEFIIKTVNK